MELDGQLQQIAAGAKAEAGDVYFLVVSGQICSHHPNKYTCWHQHISGEISSFSSHSKQLGFDPLKSPGLD